MILTLSRSEPNPNWGKIWIWIGEVSLSLVGFSPNHVKVNIEIKYFISINPV